MWTLNDLPIENNRIAPGAFLDLIRLIDIDLPKLINGRIIDEQGDINEVWKSLFINYEPPHVERLYTQVGLYRIMLHRITPVIGADPLFHPHPWPSAVKIIDGWYDMVTGVVEGCPINAREIGVGATITLAPLSLYEMVDYNGWHSVNPQWQSHSLMVAGPPWEKCGIGLEPRQMPKSEKVGKLEPLPIEDAKALMRAFRRFYSLGDFGLPEHLEPNPGLQPTLEVTDGLSKPSVTLSSQPLIQNLNAPLDPSRL